MEQRRQAEGCSSSSSSSRNSTPTARPARLVRSAACTLMLLLLIALPRCCLSARPIGGSGAAVTAGAVPSEQQQQQQGDGKPAAAAAPIDLGNANFTAAFEALPPGGAVVVEFYASWCPHCRAFKPEYDAVAAYCGAAAAGIGVYRVDCAAEPEVCARFDVRGYPTLLAGRAAAVAAGNASALTDYESFRPPGAGVGRARRDAARVVAWLASVFNLELDFKAAAAAESSDGKGSSSGSAVKAAAAAAAAAGGGVEWREADAAGATWMLFDQIAGVPLGAAGARGALERLLKLFATAHPVARCRAGAGAALAKLPEVWPDDSGDSGAASAPSAADVRALQPCAVELEDSGGGGGGEAAGAQQRHGDPAPTRAAGGGGAPAWAACRGSTPESRGYTCGLWLLFHATAARLPERDGGKLMVSALRGFARHFFLCKVCQRHFTELVSRPAADAVVSSGGRDAAVLWLWRAHNEVNARLAAVEREHGGSSSGDPAVTKVQWPSAAACPSCRRGSGGDGGSGSKKGASGAKAAGAEGGDGKEEDGDSAQPGAPAAAVNTSSNSSSGGGIDWDEARVLAYLYAAYGGPAPDGEGGGGGGGGGGDFASAAPAGAALRWLAFAAVACAALAVAKHSRRVQHAFKTQ